MAKICSLIRGYFERERLEYELSFFTNGESLANVFASGARFDIYFLDIQMSGLNGMELAKNIREHDEESVIVFITSTMAYAVDGYKVKAFVLLNR